MNGRTGSDKDYTHVCMLPYFIYTHVNWDGFSTRGSNCNHINCGGLLWHFRHEERTFQNIFVKDLRVEYQF